MEATEKTAIIFYQNIYVKWRNYTLVIKISVLHEIIFLFIIFTNWEKVHCKLHFPPVDRADM